MYMNLSVQIKCNGYSGVGCHRGAILFGRHKPPAVDSRNGCTVQGAVTGGTFHPGTGYGAIGGDCHTNHGGARNAGPSGRFGIAGCRCTENLDTGGFTAAAFPSGTVSVAIPITASAAAPAAGTGAASCAGTGSGAGAASTSSATSAGIRIRSRLAVTG